MPLGLLLFNVFSLSTSLAALVALGALFLHFRSRGVALLMGSVAFLVIDYVLGLLLFFPRENPLWHGLGSFVINGDWAATAFGLKGLCHVGELATAPLAVLMLMGGKPSRAALWAGGAAVLAASSAMVGIMAGFVSHGPFAVFATTAAPAYAAYVICCIILIRRRKTTAQRGLARSIRRAATVMLCIFVPALVTADVFAFLGGGPMPVDAVAFIVLTGGILVCSFLVLVGPRRLAATDVDAFCAAYDISVRERDVLLLLGQGLRYKQIGDRLGISLDTVKTHVARIYRKTSASGKTDLFYRIRLGGR